MATCDLWRVTSQKGGGRSVPSFSGLRPVQPIFYETAKALKFERPDGPDGPDGRTERPHEPIWTPPAPRPPGGCRATPHFSFSHHFPFHTTFLCRQNSGNQPRITFFLFIFF